jgi:hypothetical protein
MLLDTRHAAWRPHWPHNGESRYGAGPLHPRRSRLRNESQKNTEADDHFDQHLDTGIRPDTAPTPRAGRTR